MSNKTKKRRQTTPEVKSRGSEGPSPEVMKRKLDRQAETIEKLRFQVDALRSTFGVGDPLLVKLAGALRVANLATVPLSGSPIDSDGSRSAETPLPGAAVHAAIRAERALRSRVGKAIAEFDRQAEHHWHAPSVTPRDQVRCRRTGCAGLDVRVDRWIGGANRIELVFCPVVNDGEVCGSRLAPA